MGAVQVGVVGYDQVQVSNDSGPRFHRQFVTPRR
jgi:hypothetical protein